MKNLITYLKTLWGAWGNLQSNDAICDGRMTVVRLSFDCRSKLLKYITVLALLLTIGSGNVWAVDPPTLSDLTFPTPVIDENFNDIDITGTTAQISSITTAQTAFGDINHLYNNNSANANSINIYAAGNNMTSKYFSIYKNSGHHVIAQISGGTFSQFGAWRATVEKTSHGYIGLFNTTTDQNAVSYSIASVVIQNNNGTITLQNGSSKSNWASVGSASSNTIDICVIYNISGSAKTYGSSISLPNMRAHVYINGTCINSAGTPTNFTLAKSSTISSFRISLPSGTGEKHMYVDDIKVYNSLPTAGACVAPTSVAITGTTKYLGGQTISLTATPTGHTGTPTYQWEKKVSGTWTPLSNGTTAGVTISGATTNNLQISPCTHENSGGYRCVVSTGATCSTKSHADDNAGYGVHVFSVYGGYVGDTWSDEEIQFSAGTSGTATVHLNAGTLYKFHIRSNNGAYYCNGTADYNGDGNGDDGTTDGWYVLKTTSNISFGRSSKNYRIYTGPEGDYTITVDIANALTGGDYVTVGITYPSVTSHPVAGYTYFEKPNDWTNVYLYWYTNDNSRLSGWSGAPEITTTTTICGTTYYYTPLGTTFSNVIFKGNGSNQWPGSGYTTTGCSGKHMDETNYASPAWAAFVTYSITFHGNNNTGGAMTDVTGICPNGSTTLVTNEYTRTGYDFTGWNTQAGGGGDSYTNLATISSINDDIDLYAQWSAQTITINLSKNNSDVGSTDGSASIKYDATAVFSSPTHAARTGYTVEGYYADAECTASKKVMTSAGVLVNYTGYVESGKWVRATTPTTLYAKWTPIPYTVTWYVEGTALTGLADGLTTVNYGSKVTGVPSPPVSSCEGTFVGWTTSADAVYDKNVTDNYTTTPTVFTNVAGSPTITGDITFYAVFKKRMED